MAELQHRTRNLLAVVQSIARQTIRTSRSLDEFVPQFEGRLRALSRVQGLLARLDHGSIDLRGRRSG
ncbi:HWE histidine kinase domain-containing protein [Methylocystis sp. H62]|uniref:HWE histidine kinase domain-containing protein n=1 Tax=Methylocystis sp. H62 TaxID=2785789 RepID=UPI0024850CA6